MACGVVLRRLRVPVHTIVAIRRVCGLMGVRLRVLHRSEIIVGLHRGADESIYDRSMWPWRADEVDGLQTVGRVKVSE